MRLVRKGKVKEVYEIDTNTLEFLFTDNISVFDKIAPTQVPYKGETLCRTSFHWFKVIEKMGIKNHLINLVSSNRMRVNRVNVIRDYNLLDINTKNYLIPLEIISRYYVAGSLYDRIKNGVIRPQELGFPKTHKVKYGEELPQPFIEQTTKLEKVDRKIGIREAMEISGLTKREYNELMETTLRIDEKICSNVKKRGLVHVDGKREFAFDHNRELMIVDTLGTADEDRFWDLERYREGEYIELSKEFVRQYYRESGYHEKLVRAREHGLREPSVPPLPDHIVREASNIYIELFEKITGEKFRPPKG